ncbi:MAG: hypothetical protein HYR89_00680 [Actinobacteria bacterium]|nr:hypothetical protein [Actinomycetota bacterium]
MRLRRGIRVTAIVIGSITLTILNYTGAIALTGPAYTATTVEDAAVNVVFGAVSRTTFTDIAQTYASRTDHHVVDPPSSISLASTVNDQP